jgi:polysaccharide export outer membrane protein
MNKTDYLPCSHPALYFVYFLVALAVSGCAVDPRITMEPNQETTIQSSSFAASGDGFDMLTDYRVSPGDQLEILFSVQTWQQAERFEIALGDTVAVKFLNASQYNETQRVRPDGTISLPFINTVSVAGKTVEELTAELKKAYSSVFRAPDILVTVPEFLSQVRELKDDLATSDRGLSRLVRVRSDGYATFPWLGDVNVVDRTIPDVSAEVNARYAEISPSLKADVILEDHASSVVYIMGQVNRPGAYPLNRPVSVIEAISLAQGTDNTADLERVVVMRRGAEKITGTMVNVSSMLNFEQGAKFFFIAKDDIVYVPKRQLASSVQFMQEIQQLLLFRGWGVNNVEIN